MPIIRKARLFPSLLLSALSAVAAVSALSPAHMAAMGASSTTAASSCPAPFGGLDTAALGAALHARLSGWRRYKGADEYYDLPLRSPYKPQVNDPARNRFGGGMGAYADDFVADVPGVPYINASPFSFSGGGGDGGEDEFSYIGTMCPKTNTYLDFWRMVWHKRTRVVVNLTHKNDRIGSSPSDKRERYWPPFSNPPVAAPGAPRPAAATAGWDIDVRTLSSTPSSDIPGLTVYVIELREKASGTTRTVSLLWYSQWEDFGDSRKIYDADFQENARNVLALANEVEALQRGVDASEESEEEEEEEEEEEVVSNGVGGRGGSSDHSSAGSSGVASKDGARRSETEREMSWIVVHCSAGVGRTGTFITILRAMHRLQFMQGIKDLSLMIDDTITHLRRSRLWMVKTDGEYATIFCALWHRLQAYGFDRPAWDTPGSGAGAAVAAAPAVDASLSGGLVRSAQGGDGVQNYRGVGFGFKRVKAGKE
jgi:protein tyrosine phosphatase